jgi:hypothetical protein
MSGVLSVVLVLAYILIGGALYFRAMAARVDPQKPFWAVHLFRPELFTQVGQGRRRMALSFYVCGGLVLIALWSLAA